jgi:hypothetical protein
MYSVMDIFRPSIVRRLFENTEFFIAPQRKKSDTDFLITMFVSVKISCATHCWVTEYKTRSHMERSCSLLTLCTCYEVHIPYNSVAISQAVKRPGYNSDHSFPRSVFIKKMWKCSSITTYYNGFIFNSNRDNVFTFLEWWKHESTEIQSKGLPHSASLLL